MTDERWQAADELDLLAAAALPLDNPWLPGQGSVRAVSHLAARPLTVARRARQTVGALGRVVRGTSPVRPEDDVRFRDAAFQFNRVFRALAQAYLVLRESGDLLIEDAELDWRSERRLRLAYQNLADALAPTNFPWSNPAALKLAIDTGGANVAIGLRRLLADLRRGGPGRPALPAAVRESAHLVGRTLAATRGAVVMRTPLFELIQYRPTTRTVFERPLLITPSVINKFYVVDLAPERSLVEYARDAGFTVFVVSWRNPGQAERRWRLDTYVAGVLDALAAVRTIARCDAAHVIGLCAGGTIVAAAVGVLAARAELDSVASLTLGVGSLDHDRGGEIRAMIDRRTASAAIAESARRGYVEGQALAGVFAWMRPYERIWHHWVDNYLLAREPSGFDIVYWAEDHTNLAAGIHRDLIEITLNNSLATPGALVVLDTPVDLRRITSDSYVVAGLKDHIIPWENCYRSCRLLGSRPRFVLASSGHVASIVNPPSGRGGYRRGVVGEQSAQEWLMGAEEVPGSWWQDWCDWLAGRSGQRRAARRRLGGADHRPLEPAPGTYVH